MLDLIQCSFKRQKSNEVNASKNVIGIFLALGSALVIAVSTKCSRKQRQLKVNKFLTVLTNAMFVTFSNAVICSASNQRMLPGFYGWIYGGAAGLCYSLAQLCLLMAVKLEKSTLVTIVLTFVFTFLWQSLFLDVLHFWTSYVGAMLLIFAIVGIPLYKQYSGRETKRKPWTDSNKN